MRKLPITLIPLVVFGIIALLFIFYIPEGRDLISSKGDFILGQAAIFSFILCLIIDVRRYFGKKK